MIPIFRAFRLHRAMPCGLGLLLLLLFAGSASTWAQTDTQPTVDGVPASLEFYESEITRLSQLLRSLEQKTEAYKRAEQRKTIPPGGGTATGDQDSTLAGKIDPLNARHNREWSELKRMLRETETKISDNRQRIEQINLNLAATTEQAGQNADLLGGHTQYLQENSTRLFEVAIKIDELQGKSQQQKPPQPTALEQHQAVPNTDSALLLRLVLCLLLPVGVLLYLSPHVVVGDRQKGRVHSGGWVLASWVGGSLGFYLLGFSIMFGASQAGWIGLPTQFFTALFSVTPQDVPPTLLSALVPHTLLAASVGIIVCSVINDRVSPLAHFFVALLFGGIIYPVFGHWITTDHSLMTGQGWLAAYGFKPSGGAASVALLAGAAGLSLSYSLRQGKLSVEPSGSAGSAGLMAAGTLLLWVAWYGIILARSPLATSPAPLISGSFLTVIGTATAALLLYYFVLPDPLRYRQFMSAALVGLISVSAAYKTASAGTLLLFGLFVGCACILALQLLRRLRPDAPRDSELAGIIAAGGLCGTIGTVLFGIDGFIFTPSPERILPQLAGIGMALLLALVVGKLLALLLNQWPQRR